MAADSRNNHIGRNGSANAGANGRLSGRQAKDARRTAGSDDAQSAELQFLTLEAALDELDRIVAALEESQRPLDESLALYERGVRLVQHSQELLDTADLRLQRLRPANEDDGFQDGFQDDYQAHAGYTLDDFELDDE